MQKVLKMSKSFGLSLSISSVVWLYFHFILDLILSSRDLFEVFFYKYFNFLKSGSFSLLISNLAFLISSYLPLDLAIY